jgi:DHA1 family multidrug resistance protein-like MFS transporter
MTSSTRAPVIVMAMITGFSILGDAMLYIVLPVYWEQFELDALWQVGVLLSVNRFVRLPLNPLIGWMYHRITKRTGILCAVCAAALTTWSYGHVHEFWILVAMRALWGAAWSLLRLGGYLTVLDAASDATRGQLLGIPCTLRFVPNTLSGADTALPRQSGAGTDLGWRSRLAGEPAFVLGSSLVVAIAVHGMYASTLSPMIGSHMPSTFAVAGIIIGAAALAGIIQAARAFWSPLLSPWCGKLMDESRSRTKLYAAALFAAALLLALLASPASFPLWLPALLAMQLAGTALSSFTDTLAAAAASRTSKVTFMAAYTTVSDIGSALGPAVCYAVAGYVGLNGSYYTAALLLVALGIVWLLPLQALYRLKSAGTDASNVVQP